MLKTKSKNILLEEEILNQFYNFPIKTDNKIGMELERLPVYNNYETAGYFGTNNNGIKKILEDISDKYLWSKIYDNITLIGLRKENNYITLEPGCQFELSLEPKKNVFDLKKEVEKIDKEIKTIFKKYNIKLLEYGITPKTQAKDIEIYPKKRYQYMAQYLKGNLASSMMRETAGIQVAIDFSNEENAIEKLRIFTKISPVMTAIFANSPIKASKLSGYKSTRALAWLHTDNDRCGLISEKLFDKNYHFTFKDYMQTVIDIPMLYISRKSVKNFAETPYKENILINGKINFREFMKSGFNDYSPILSDYSLHQSLFFPEVRLKNYIEIRNHDCQNGELKYSIPAIYKGLAYDKDILNSLIKLFDEFNYSDIQQARYDVPKLALNANFGQRKIIDLAKEVIELSKTGLKNSNDKIFIEPIEELVKENLCPADIVIKNFIAKNKITL